MRLCQQLLFSELAQILSKDKKESIQKYNQEKKTLAVVKQQEVQLKEVDQLTILEKEIIRILLLYGNEEANFTEEEISHDEDGKETIKHKKYTNTVSSEIYLHLQDDEIEFTNPIFQEIYNEIIYQLNQSKKITIEDFVNHESSNISRAVTSILMDEEKHHLSNWERKNIFVTEAIEVLTKAVNDAVYNLRRILIDEKIKEMTNEKREDKSSEIDLELVKNYIDLKKRLFLKLNRVI